MKLSIFFVAALISAVTAIGPEPESVCCKAVAGACPLPGEPQPSDLAVLTPKGYLNERTGVLSARAPEICCCLAVTQADCKSLCG